MYNDHIDKIVPPDLLDKQDLPRIVIISVSVIGIFFLITNIVLVAGCILKRIRGSFSHLIFYLLAQFIIDRSSLYTCFIFFFQNKVIKLVHRLPSKSVLRIATTIPSQMKHYPHLMRKVKLTLTKKVTMIAW